MTIPKSKFVKAGAWRTLEYGWNAVFGCRFVNPAGAQVRVRYGANGFPGWSSQTQTLDGNPKLVKVTRASIAYARVQIKVREDTLVEYAYLAVGEF